MFHNQPIIFYKFFDRQPVTDPPILVLFVFNQCFGPRLQFCGVSSLVSERQPLMMLPYLRWLSVSARYTAASFAWGKYPSASEVQRGHFSLSFNLPAEVLVYIETEIFGFGSPIYYFLVDFNFLKFIQAVVLGILAINIAELLSIFKMC